MGLLDFIFPKACVGCGRFGSYLCLECERKVHYLDTQFCPECGKAAIGGATHPFCLKPYGLDGLISLTYFTFPINKIVHSLKYRFTTDLLGEVAVKIQADPNLLNQNAVLLPVPLHWQRKNYRGFNQAEVLGQLYAQKFSLGFENKFLKRSVKTRQQVGLKRDERLINLKGAFTVVGDLRGKDLVVFDDVWTTGSTLKNVGQSLKRAGASKVWGLTLARSH